MNKNLQKLIGTLRSGDYTQCRGQLRRIEPDETERHCCLGVAAELYRADTGKGEFSSGLAFVTTSRDYRGYLPVDVLNHYGLDEVMASTMVRWNDALDLKFSEIADRLEAEYA